MNDRERLGLQAAVFRNTAKEPTWLGYWLARHQQSEDLDEQQLAVKLGVPMEKLVLLCLCRTPRPDQFREDLAVVCQYTGAKEEVLAQILRREQILRDWTQAGQAPTSGWLMAASDKPDEEPPPPATRD